MAEPERVDVLGRFVTYRKLRVAQYMQITEQMQRHSEVKIGHMNDDFIRNRLTATMESFVWGMVGDRVEVKVPLDWWQAFKERWFPLWALARWPVVYWGQTWQAVELVNREFPPDRDTIRVLWQGTNW
jgi:hypothetical protein